MIGIDVGGANVKVAWEGHIAVRYCPLWERSPLGNTLRETLEEAGSDADHVAVVMSGELADCFESKAEGIAWIVGQVRDVCPDAFFYGIDGEFHRKAVPELAASNWLASADYLRTLFPRALLVDIGSTTTDIVPLGLFEQLMGMTDLDRLRAGFLRYTGLLRTPIAAHLSQATIGGIPTPLSTEFFATSADAHLLLHHITPAGYTCAPADGGGTATADATRRLSRMACSDPEEIGPTGPLDIARQFWKAQQEIIEESVSHVQQMVRADPVITAGIGSTLLAQTFGWRDLRGTLGESVDALPAFAVREVAIRSGFS